MAAGCGGHCEGRPDEQLASQSIDRPARARTSSAALEFINLTTPGHIRDPGIQDVIRKHAWKSRREHSRVVRSKDDEVYAGPTTWTSNNAEDAYMVSLNKATPNSYELTARDGANNLGSPRPRLSFGEGGFQALWLFPSHLSAPANAPSLISHLFEVLAPFMYNLGQGPDRYRSSLWILGTMDSAAFLVTLCTAATHLARLKGRESSQQSLTLKGEALRQVNARLENIPSATSDETIAAILSLAALEHIFGDLRAWQYHMAGLERIVNLRGGLHSLRTNRRLQALLSWSDINVSCVLDRIPQFPLADNADSIFPPAPETTAAYKALEAHGLCESLLRVARDLATFTAEIQTAKLGILLESNWSNTRQKISSLFHRLLQRPETLGSQWTSNVVFDELCRLAMLIHLCQIFSFYQRSPPVRNGNNVKKLRTKLSENTADWILNDLGSLKMWILFVGISDCSEADDWHWFADQLQTLLLGQGLSRWTDIEQILKMFWWSGEDCSKLFLGAFMSLPLLVSHEPIMIVKDDDQIKPL